MPSGMRTNATKVASLRDAVCGVGMPFLPGVHPYGMPSPQNRSPPVAGERLTEIQKFFPAAVRGGGKQNPIGISDR
ncbi:MAG: hypothetical protein LBD52_02970 [Prevotellaceae bacterium]|nr:hypothetical protein [Prevotellaceae bacterium]